LNDAVKTFILMSMNTEFELLFKLSRAERLQLVEDLWGSIVQVDEELSVSEEKRAELRRRKERFLAHPSSGCTWEQVKQRARTQHD
jgi:putative addiction module component (TIGR02574 family)